MAFTFKLHITGLVAYQPKKDVTEGNNSCVLILPNARKFIHGSKKEPHRPVWIVEERYLAKSGNRTPNGTVRKDEVSPKFMVFDLDLNPGLTSDIQGDGSGLKMGRNWAIEPSRVDRLTFAHNPDEPPAECPTDGNRFDFRWVGQLETIEAGTGTIKAIALGNNPGHGGMASRVYLHEGTLATSQFASEDGDPSKRPIKWTFQSALNKDGHSTALAEVVTLTREAVVGDEIKLIPARWHEEIKNPPDDPIVLKPQDGVVEVWLKNQPYADFLGDPTGSSAKDHHFLAFYQMCADPKNRMIPVRNGYCGEEPDVIGPASVGNPQCPGTRFEP